MYLIKISSLFESLSLMMSDFYKTTGRHTSIIDTQVKTPKPIIITNVFSVQYHLSCRMTLRNQS